MGSDIGLWSDWTIVARCPHCQHDRRIEVSRLVAWYGPLVKVQHVVMRLRCSTKGCGAAPYRVRMEEPGRGGRIVPVVGPEAYG